LITFVLGLLGHIDQAFGLTSGTAGGAIASLLYLRAFSAYEKPATKVERP
jgi:hypothetical protein